MSASEASWKARWASRLRSDRGRLMVSVMAGVLSAMIGIAFVPPQHSTLGPAQVTTRASMGNGDTIVRIPPFGSVVASTHSSPLRFELSVAQVDIESLAQLATTPSGRAEIEREVRSGLRDLAIESMIRFTIGGIIAAILVAAFLFHRRTRFLVGAASGALVATLVLFAGAAGTYRMEGFEEPKFTGSLTKARQVIAALSSGSQFLDETRSRFEVASRRVSDLLVLLAQPDRDPLDQSTVILHVTDIHANPIGLEITEELAREFDADAIVDTGDLASSVLDTGAVSDFAAPIDDAFARGIESMQIPYLYVAGNHDSPRLRSTIAGAANVVELHDQATLVGLARVVGWHDPTYSLDPIPEATKQEQRLAVAPEVAAMVDRLRPDILAVHDERLASEAFGLVPIVLAGHTHERNVQVVDGTLILTLGSTGATGLKSLTVETDEDYEAQLIYLDGDELVAVDHISLSGVGGEFQLERSTHFRGWEPGLASVSGAGTGSGSEN